MWVRRCSQHDALCLRTRAARSGALRRSRLWFGLRRLNRLAVHERPTILHLDEQVAKLALPRRIAAPPPPSGAGRLAGWLLVERGYLELALRSRRIDPRTTPSTMADGAGSKVRARSRSGATTQARGRGWVDRVGGTLTAWSSLWKTETVRPTSAVCKNSYADGCLVIGRRGYWLVFAQVGRRVCRIYLTARVGLASLSACRRRSLNSARPFVRDGRTWV